MPNPRAALKQAKEDAKPGMVPLGVIGDDRQPPFVVLELDDFLDFIKEWWHLAEEYDSSFERADEINRDAVSRLLAAIPEGEPPKCKRK